MADQPQPQAQPTVLDHATFMLDQLRAYRPGDAHELARAMLASAACFLVEVFGREHALQVASDVLRPALGVPEVLEGLPGEIAGSGEPGPGVVLH